MNENIIEKLKMLDGITLSEWKKLSYIIDTTFKHKESELERSLKLTFEEAEKVTHAQFG